jgi:hypothetical protein
VGVVGGDLSRWGRGHGKVMKCVIVGDGDGYTRG